MSRPYTTTEDQTIYDICVQKFGGLDDIDELMRISPDLNDALPVNTEMVLSDTEDELAKRFDVNNTYFATGLAFDEPDLCLGFNYTFNYTFCKEV